MNPATVDGAHHSIDGTHPSKAPKPLTVIEPRKGFALTNPSELWSFRELAWMLAERDIKVRYKHTALGIAWAVLRPLLTMLMFTAVFGRLGRMPSDGLPYPVFVLAGLLPWMFFAQATSGAAQSIVGAGSLVTRIYFPRILVPLAATVVAFADLLVALGLLIPLLLWFHVVPGVAVLVAPVVLVAAFIVALGSGVWLAALTATYRDVKHIEPFLLQLWMLATPVIYPASLVPERWRWLTYVNPMTGVVEGFRACLLGIHVDGTGLLISAVTGLIVLTTGGLYFWRIERRFADLI